MSTDTDPRGLLARCLAMLVEQRRGVTAVTLPLEDDIRAYLERTAPAPRVEEQP